MRKLIYAINLTIDGCCDHTKFYPDEETMPYVTQLTRDAGTFLYGRKTYQLMVPYWPDEAKNHPDDEFAQAFVAVDNMVVFSRTLEKADGKNTRIVGADLKDEVLKLKQEPGKNIFTSGVDISSQLMQLGLIDEYHFVVHPLIVGEGRRFFDGVSLPEKLQLKLVESKIFKSGSVALHYLKQ